MGKGVQSPVQQKTKVSIDRAIKDLIEVIIFTLSPVLGGRREVLLTPLSELFAYVDMEKRRKTHDRYHRFMDSLYSTHQGIDKRKRQQYMESIRPKEVRKKLEMKTNVDQLKALKAQQQQDAHALKQGGS